MKNYEFTRAQVNVAGNYIKGTVKTKAGNRGLLNLKPGEIQSPVIKPIKGRVLYDINGGPAVMEAKVEGEMYTLDNNESGNGFSATPRPFNTADMIFDLSPNTAGDRRKLEQGGTASDSFGNSVEEAFYGINGFRNVASAKFQETQEGVDARIKQFTDDTPVELIMIKTMTTLAVDCSDAPAKLAKQKPQVFQFDTDCNKNDLLKFTASPGLTKRTVGGADFSPKSWNEVWNVPLAEIKEYPCGTAHMKRRYTSTDCYDQTDWAEQTIYIRPEAPVFKSVPEVTSEKTFSTRDSIDPIGDNFPSAEGECGGSNIYRIVLDSTDAQPMPVEPEEENCGLWEVARRWTATLEFGDEITSQCETYGMPSPPSAEAMQYYNVQDDEPPSIRNATAEILHIPFFDNYESNFNNAPLLLDRATNIQARQWGLAVGGVSLTSTDSSFVSSSFDFNDEQTCRDQGIAQFTRTWTAADKCGNFKTYTQTIVLDHPPIEPTSTESLAYGIHSFAPGVTQSADVCVPGKFVAMGDKTFEADFDIFANQNACDPGKANLDDWDENGCRLKQNKWDQKLEIISVAPVFASFPSDRTITTKESLDPDNTGKPTGRAFCNTPFQIFHTDDAAKLTDCGVWTIDRHWIVRPLYVGCEAVTDRRLITEQVQVITVKDIFPPEFIVTPDAEVSVPFLENYGTDAVGVPDVEDIIYHSTLVDHDAIHRKIDGLFRFVSYSITLTYSDKVTFKAHPSEVCESGALATVERTWTTTDYCSQRATWMQTISIVKPSTKLFGDASGFQLATPNGELKLHKSRIAQDIFSLGEDFDMHDSIIHCTSDFRTNCDLTGRAHASVVLDSCPGNKLEMTSLTHGTVLYADPPVLDDGGKSKKGKGESKFFTSCGRVSIHMTLKRLCSLLTLLTRFSFIATATLR
jgi:hypothetical protein